ncbi:MAG TPA: alpha-ketoglutarate-dependent dioxygenase AlkB, partial [Thermopetrobacter sp.]|nr:alpha-ketoglutarate-dependent dioxygenase AlkB [Thermopetrobacter sp.]
MPATRRVAVPPSGLRHLPGLLTREERAALLADIVAALETAPFFTPRMPRTGRPFSVRMTGFGPLGWVSDREGGYRYQPRHPLTGGPWPPLPPLLLRLWERLCDWPDPPEAALVNHYRPGARMGLHVDVDEQARDAPLLSISLGCTGIFRIGGRRRRDPTMSFPLA